MSAGLKKESCYQHVSLLACCLISNLIVSCLYYFNNIISACFPKYTLFLVLREYVCHPQHHKCACSNIFGQKKDSHRSAVFQEKVFYYGDSKKYIMYWGVFTVIIVSPWPLKVSTNMHKFLIIFCAVLLIKMRCPKFNSPYINRKRKPPLLRVMVFFF